MKNIYKKYFSILSFFLIFILCACVKHTHVEASDIECLKSGDTHVQHAHIKHIYLSVQGTSQSKPFLSALQKSFAAHGFSMAAKPSAADLIVQINVCHAGDMKRSDAERALKTGYGTKVKVKGSEVAGLVVDALLVTRIVPEAQSDKQRKLKNISQRRASGSSTLRLVLLSEKGVEMRPIPQSFAACMGETLYELLESKKEP